MFPVIDMEIISFKNASMNKFITENINLNRPENVANFKQKAKYNEHTEINPIETP